MRDIPLVPDGPGLIAYLEILERVLIPPPSVIAQARAAERGKGEGNDVIHVDRNKMPRPSTKHTKEDISFEAKGTSTGVQRDGKKGPAIKGGKDSPVSVLINVVRKSLHSFISTDETLESAWMCLLKAFRRFDPSENGTVSPRDFCLAVSVLLGGDEVLLSEAAWIEIIEQFTFKDDKKSRASRSASSDKNSAVQVDYMEFCGVILDSKDIKLGRDAMKGLASNIVQAENAMTSTGSKTLAVTGTRPVSGAGGKSGTTTQGSMSREKARGKRN